MQSLAWYIRRISSMSLAEILWRGSSFVRDGIDRYRVAFACYPSIDSALPKSRRNKIEAGFTTHPPNAGSGREGYQDEWRRRLFAKADQAAEHRLTFFNLKAHFMGDPVEWNRDHAHGIEAPCAYAPSIDYRDFRLTGDCKLVWEPNRHHQLVVLGRAYHISGDVKYAAAVVDQMTSWMDQCPYGKGMNWRSSLELGIRLINWVFSLDLIQESGLVAGEFCSRLMHTVYLHLWEITRKYSRGSSANNHLIGEAAGVFVASSYFKQLNHVDRWRKESHRLLSEEILKQTYADGCTREQAMGYHLFVLKFFLLAGLVGRWTGMEFSSEYWIRLEKMMEFAGVMSEGGENLPSFGDCDDGYVLDLGTPPADVRPLLCIGSILFKRQDFKTTAKGYAEDAWWLLGNASRETYDAMPVDTDPRLKSWSFPEAGYYLLQSGKANNNDRISLLFDCGELGFKSIAAHGHADALSFVLRVGGRDIFIDPGTYDYFTYPAWRNYFRSTKAHNTVLIDGIDQSVMLGPFMWGERARTKCVSWEPAPEEGGKVAGEHDGYRRLSDPVVHRRNIELNASARAVNVCDDISAGADHSISLIFHLSEICTATCIDSHTVEIYAQEEALKLEVDSRLKLSLVAGSENPICGWVSRGYHQKIPSITIIAEGSFKGSNTFLTHIRIKG